MKKILFLLFFTLISNFIFAQGAGTRYVNGVPSAGTYTPNLSKNEAVKCYSLTSKKFYFWDAWNNQWVEEKINEITTSSTLPSTAASVGNKVLYISSSDTSELTYLGNNRWKALYIKSPTTPTATVTSGSQTIDFTGSTWINTTLKNKNFVYKAGTFRPVEGDYFVDDFGILTTNTGAQNSAAWLTLQTYLTTSTQVKNVIFREGTYNFQDSIIVRLDYNIRGISKYNTILHFNGGKGFNLQNTTYSANIHISDMTIEGDNGGTIGTYQRYKSGIYSYGGSFDRWNCEYKNLIIRYFKGSGIDCKNHFTSSYINIEVDKNNGHGFDEDGGNTVLFQNCYAQTIATWYAGYRIHTNATLKSCNGVNSGKYWGIFGDNLLDDGRNAAGNVNLYDCNLEAYGRAGIMYKYPSGGSISNSAFAPTTTGTVIILGRNQTGGGSYVDLQNVKVQNCGFSPFVNKSLLMDTIRTAPIFEQVGETQSYYTYKSLFGNTKTVSVNRLWESGSIIGEQDYIRFVNNLTANNLQLNWLANGTTSDSLLVSSAGNVKRLAIAAIGTPTVTTIASPSFSVVNSSCTITNPSAYFVTTGTEVRINLTMDVQISPNAVTNGYIEFNMTVPVTIASAYVYGTASMVNVATTKSATAALVKNASQVKFSVPASNYVNGEMYKLSATFSYLK